VTPSVSSTGAAQASPDSAPVTATDPARCTTGCTSPAGTIPVTQESPLLAALATALQALSPADRARLVALLQTGAPPPSSADDTGPAALAPLPAELDAEAARLEPELDEPVTPYPEDAQGEPGPPGRPMLPG
jgi:hypothetical protein